MVFLAWIVVAFVIIGGALAMMKGFNKGPDYSSETDGKVLDTSDNTWKTPEELMSSANSFTQIVNSVQ
jgi:hypothetical protein